MASRGHISFTFAFVFAFAIAPVFLQHCVMADGVLPRILHCEEERPVEPCHDDDEAAPVEWCCAEVEAAITEDAVATPRTGLPALIVAAAPFVPGPSMDRREAASGGRPDTLPPPAPRERLSIVLCTFLC